MVLRLSTPKELSVKDLVLVPVDDLAVECTYGYRWVYSDISMSRKNIRNAAFRGAICEGHQKLLKALGRYDAH